MQLVFVVCVLLDSLLGILSKRFSYSIASKAQTRLREKVFDTVLHADYLSIQNRNMSELITTMTYGIDNLEGILSKCITVCIGNTLSILVILAVMFSLSPKLTFISILVFPILITLSSKLGKWIDKTNQEMQRCRTQVSQNVEETLACLIGIRNNNLESYMENRFHQNTNRMKETNVRRNTIFEIMNRASWTLVIVPYQAVLYGVGGTLAILYGAPTIGTLLIFANFTNSLIQPVMGLVQMLGDLAMSADSFARIDSVFEIQQQEQQRFESPKEKEHDLELQSLTYRYPDQAHPVIDGLSAVFSSGETTILWGRSGCGKSTLLKLIGGLIPCPDTARMRKNTEKRWGYFPQNPTLFDMTLRENFQLVHPGMDEQAMWNLLDAVDMTASVQGKKQGLDCPVSRNDCLFSMGEYRRICLAVFFAREADVLLFDEPTASLDKKSAESIASILKRKADEKKTLILATHDPNLRMLGTKEIRMSD